MFIIVKDTNTDIDIMSMSANEGNQDNVIDILIENSLSLGFLDVYTVVLTDEEYEQLLLDVPVPEPLPDLGERIDMLEMENSGMLFQNASQDMTIQMLQDENADALLQNALQDMTIQMLQDENADSLFQRAAQEMTIQSLQDENAEVIFRLANLELGGII